jgi:hypothetical protein
VHGIFIENNRYVLLQTMRSNKAHVQDPFPRRGRQPISTCKLFETVIYDRQKLRFAGNRPPRANCSDCFLDENANEISRGLLLRTKGIELRFCEHFRLLTKSITWYLASSSMYGLQ